MNTNATVVQPRDSLLARAHGVYVELGAAVDKALADKNPLIGKVPAADALLASAETTELDPNSFQLFFT
jgi:hypothetical protein